MDVTRASAELEVIIAIGAYFAILVVIAAIDLWHGTARDGRSSRPHQ
jgi:hypothetical protein